MNVIFDMIRWMSYTCITTNSANHSAIINIGFNIRSVLHHCELLQDECSLFFHKCAIKCSVLPLNILFFRLRFFIAMNTFCEV